MNELRIYSQVFSSCLVVSVVADMPFLYCCMLNLACYFLGGQLNILTKQKMDMSQVGEERHKIEEDQVWFSFRLLAIKKTVHLPLSCAVHHDGELVICHPLFGKYTIIDASCVPGDDTGPSPLRNKPFWS